MGHAPRSDGRSGRDAAGPERPPRDVGPRRPLARGIVGALGGDRIFRWIDGLVQARVREALERALSSTVTAAVNHARLHEYVVWGDPNRLTIDETAIVNNALFNLSSGTITVGPWAALGHR